LADPIGVIREIMSSPGALVTWFPLLFFVAYEAFFIPFGFTFWGVMLGASILLPIVLGVGLSYLANLGQEGAPEGVAELVPGAVSPSGDQPKVVATGFSSGIATPGATGVPAAPATSAVAPPPPAAGVMGFGYLIAGADPGTGLGPTLTEGNKAQAPASRVPAAAAAVGSSARDKARARRRRRAVLHDHADEYMDLDAGPAAGPRQEPATGTSAAGSDRGAGALGFTGTVGKRGDATAAGLATLAGNGFGGGPSVPMLPDSWNENDHADSVGESEVDSK
jgi:PPE-repeat protein